MLAGAVTWPDILPFRSSAIAAIANVAGTPVNYVLSFCVWPHTSLQIHALVARGTTILAEHQAGKRDFSQGKGNSEVAV